MNIQFASGRRMTPFAGFADLTLSWLFNLNRLLAWMHGLLSKMSSDGESKPPGSVPLTPPSVGISGNAASLGVLGGPKPPYAVDDLYRRYAGSLYWVCLRYVKNREDAEDLVNQVFLQVQNHLHSFQGQSSIYSWMYRIAVNECIQLFRKRKFETDGDYSGLFEDSLPTFPEREWIAKLTMNALFRKTDSQTVEIVFLLYYEGLSQDEVVEKLGISRRTLNRKVAAFKTVVEANQ
jgi:RNA polymerase sigma-70 factor, ECF subfamily